MEKSYKYLGYVLLLLAPLTFIGFYRTYFGLFPEFENTLKVHHIHAAVASMWIGLLIVQPLLIQFRKPAWHRILGKFSYFLFPALLFTFFLMIQLHDGSLQGMFGTIADAVLLTLLFVLAIIYRRQTGKHMRYIIASALVLLGPVLARLVQPVFGIETFTWYAIIIVITDMILLGLIAYDAVNKKNYRPYLVALLGFSVEHIAVYFVYYY